MSEEPFSRALGYTILPGVRKQRTLASLQGLLAGLGSSKVEFEEGVTAKVGKKAVSHSVRWHSDMFSSLGIFIFGQTARF